MVLKNEMKIDQPCREQIMVVVSFGLYSGCVLRAYFWYIILVRQVRTYDIIEIILDYLI
jgi:hypothetical protein